MWRLADEEGIRAALARRGYRAVDIRPDAVGGARRYLVSFWPPVRQWGLAVRAWGLAEPAVLLRLIAALPDRRTLPSPNAEGRRRLSR